MWRALWLINARRFDMAGVNGINGPPFILKHDCAEKLPAVLARMDDKNHKVSFHIVKTATPVIAIVQKMSIRTGSLEIETEQVFCIRTQLSA